MQPAELDKPANESQICSKIIDSIGFCATGSPARISHTQPQPNIRREPPVVSGPTVLGFGVASLSVLRRQSFSLRGGRSGLHCVKAASCSLC